MSRHRSWMRLLVSGAVVAFGMAVSTTSVAQDAATIVARAREQVENGNYQEAAKTLGSLRGKELPAQLAVEAGLLESTALLVAQGQEPATSACERAVVAAGYDPEVARDQSPKVREVCREAAKIVRAGRLREEGATLGKLDAKDPELAYQPIRLSTTLETKPTWLKVVARVESSAIEGTFDVPLIPSDEGPLRGTLDASWIRPRAKLKIALVAQDKFGDLGPAVDQREVTVPMHEALVALGTVPTSAKVAIDDKPVTPDAQGRVPASAGKHDVRLTLASGATAEASVELRRGGITRVALTPQEPSPSRVLPWIATGTALALGVAGGVLLINGELRRDELEEAAALREPGTGLPATEYAELRSIDEQRTTFNTVGIALLIASGATAGLATTLWLLPTGDSNDEDEGASARSPTVTPVLGPGFVGATGSF